MLTIQRDSNIPSVVSSLIVKESNKDQKKRSKGDQKINEVGAGGRGDDLRVQKNLRGWLSERKSSKFKQ